jgi:hypothetical protein
MEALRTLSQSIAIYESGVHAWGDRWTAAVMVRRKELCDERAAYHEYMARGASPESALAALKEAVAKGEEGWTW